MSQSKYKYSKSKISGNVIQFSKINIFKEIIYWIENIDSFQIKKSKK